MMKKYKDIKVGEFFEDEGYHYVKTVCLNENSQIEYPAIELESGVTVYFSDDDENYYEVAEYISKVTGGGYFTVIKEWEHNTIDSTYHYQIVYANDTKVKYLILTNVHTANITPLYNADGSVQVYEESEE